MKVIPRLILAALSAYYLGWKVGQKDKEREIAGDDPCIIDVAGELKPVPGAVCDVITKSRSLLNAGPMG